MNRLFRFLGVVFWLFIFFIRGSFIKLSSKDTFQRRMRQVRNTSFISRMLLKPFHLSVKITNPDQLSNLAAENHLIVSNHVSYLDIVVLSSSHPFVFITSTEMGSNPVLGDITRLGGSLYTNRKKYNTLPLEINNFAAALQQGFDLVLFPEGTSTNGATIYPFKKSLFQTSIIAKKGILPICIRYKTLDGQPILTQEQRDVICWYGTNTFIPHLWAVLGHDIEAEVNILDPIPFNPALNRQQISDEVHSRLLHIFQTD